MPRAVRYERTASERRRLAAAGRCIDCGCAARPVRVTGPSSLRERTHHRCHPCYRMWQRRRSLWDRLMRARAHARVVLKAKQVCSVCSFVSEAGAVGYAIVSAPPAEAVASYVCADCHEDCHAEFGGVPHRVARVVLADYGLFADGRDIDGLALVVAYADGVPALAAAARRLAYEFSSDFPLALSTDVLARAVAPGAVEAFLHVRPERVTPAVLFALVEAALLVLRADRVELAYPPALRKLILSEVYASYGALVRRRVVPSRLRRRGSG